MSNILIMDDYKNKMPTLEECLEYAKHCLKKVIYNECKRMPLEHQNEVSQDAMVRIINAYGHIDPDEGWKSFVYKHCFGAAKDYKKQGKGFEEDRKTTKKSEEAGSKRSGKIKNRIDLVDAKGEQADIDDVLGWNGVFESLRQSKEKTSNIEINWNLVARMATLDPSLYTFALFIRGHTLDNIGVHLGKSPQRTWAIIQAFVDRFDDPLESENPWFLQTIYAFGLCETMGLKNIDQSIEYGFKIGWNHPPAELDNINTEKRKEIEQIEMFKMDEVS